MTLDGMRVLVTGASAGIGAAIATTAANAGANVALLARREDRIKQLADEIGGVAVTGDVTDLGGAQALIDRAAAELGGLDALVNNAGIMRPGLIADGDPEEWRAMFNVNVLGLLAMTQAAIPHLQEAAGSIVNISSMAGRRVPSATSGVYSATKFAVHAISQALAMELEGQGIRVTTVSPGFVSTELFEDLQDSEVINHYRSTAKRVGIRTDDVAQAVLHALAAPASVTTVEIAMTPTSGN